MEWNFICFMAQANAKEFKWLGTNRKEQKSCFYPRDNFPLRQSNYNTRKRWPILYRCYGGLLLKSQQMRTFFSVYVESTIRWFYFANSHPTSGGNNISMTEVACFCFLLKICSNFEVKAFFILLGDWQLENQQHLVLMDLLNHGEITFCAKI